MLPGEWGVSRNSLGTGTRCESKGGLLRHIYLPASVEIPQSDSVDYPRIQDDLILDCFNLKVRAPLTKVIVHREKTCLEARTDLKMKPGEVLGGKYQIQKVLGKTGFSRVYSVGGCHSGH